MPRWRNPDSRCYTSLRGKLVYLPRTNGAAVVELAYTYVSGTYGRKAVRVQVPPAAPFAQGTKLE